MLVTELVVMETEKLEDETLNWKKNVSTTHIINSDRWSGSEQNWIGELIGEWMGGYMNSWMDVCVWMDE